MTQKRVGGENKRQECGKEREPIPLVITEPTYATAEANISPARKKKETGRPPFTKGGEVTYTKEEEKKQKG